MSASYQLLINCIFRISYFETGEASGQIIETILLINRFLPNQFFNSVFCKKLFCVLCSISSTDMQKQIKESAIFLIFFVSVRLSKN